LGKLIWLILSRTSAIALSLVTFNLNLTRHNIQISQEGTVIINAEYIGAIEGKMFSPDTDVLYVGSESQAKLSDVNRSLKLNKKFANNTKNAVSIACGSLTYTVADAKIANFTSNTSLDDIQVASITLEAPVKSAASISIPA
jgi:hypothetical protein